MQLTAEQILGMTARDAAALFPGDNKTMKRGFAKLVAKWHPDVCSDPRAEDVFTHILSLRDRVSGQSRKSVSQRVLKTADGKALGIAPLSTHAVDQGEILVGKRTISTLFTKALSDLAQREAGASTAFRFAGETMRDQMRPFLPHIIESKAMEGGSTLVITKKDPEEILLADLLASRGAMPDVHAAWLCSGLLNIAAWMEFSQLVHGAIAPETVLIDPAKHSVRLASGWAFVTKRAERPIALPGRTLSLVPRMAIKGQPAESRMDLDLIRQTVRDALGDPRGTAGGVASLPTQVGSWLAMPPAETAVEDYAAWQRALESGWGKRRFVDYPVRAADIYAR